jgi:putative FmdB family regulatory protein
VPTYGYRCDNGHEFEVIQKIADETLTTACVECGAPVQRVYHPIAVHFKGSGFYTTDYARKKEKASADSDGAGASKDSGKKDKSGGDKKKEKKKASSERK